jgi:hypothetical protein
VENVVPRSPLPELSSDFALEAPEEQEYSPPQILRYSQDDSVVHRRTVREPDIYGILKSAHGELVEPSQKPFDRLSVSEYGAYAHGEFVESSQSPPTSSQYSRIPIPGCGKLVDIPV